MKVRKIGQSRKTYHRDIGKNTVFLPFPGENGRQPAAQAVLILDIHIHVRRHSYDRNPA